MNHDNVELSNSRRIACLKSDIYVSVLDSVYHQSEECIKVLFLSLETIISTYQNGSLDGKLDSDYNITNMNVCNICIISKFLLEFYKSRRVREAICVIQVLR